MVIKSKKWKSIISFCAFFLSVSLLLTNVAAFGYRLLNTAWSNRDWSELREQDYQNTTDFREHIEAKLSDFLKMATGGDISGYYDGYYGWDYDYGYDYDYDYSYYDDDYEYAYETRVVTGTGMSINSEATTELETAEDFSTNRAEAAASKEQEEAAKKEQNLKNAQHYHEAIKNDKNLLYRISYDGKELYSNMEAGSWSKLGDDLPDGYNFLLYFDGEKVTVLKDGQELNIYGDGFYQEGSDWCVPGYQNFTVDEDTKKANVVLMAAKNPIKYSYMKYGAGGFEQESRLYYISSHTERKYQQLKNNIAGLILGIGIFIVFLIFFRKDKKLAEQKLGNLLGKVWFEGRLIALLAVLTGIFISSDSYYIGEYIAYNYWYMDGGLGMELLIDVINNFCVNPVSLLLLFWLLYLLVLDIRQNRGSFFQGLISRAAKKFETKNLKLNFSKRMVRRFIPVFLVSLILSIAALFFVFYVDGLVIEYPAAVVCGILGLGGLLGVHFWYLSNLKRQSVELDLLTERIREVHEGNYSGEGKLPADSELKEAETNLEEIQYGMEFAMEERMKSERLKVELVANVSHDIKTPLTSIISYVQFLKQEENLPEHVKDYIRILDEKSERLKNMVQDVFAVSKAASGQLPVEMEQLDFGKLLRQTLADMEEQIENSSVTVKSEIPETPVMIKADGKRMYRVFQNLIQNALNYSLDGSRIFITLKADGSAAIASVKNTSRQELTDGTDFTERFIRGDESRTDGGSGLGLSIAKSFTEACGGTFELEIIADLFVVSVSFPK